MKLARIPVLLICHDSLSLRICEPWQVTGQYLSAVVPFVHLKWGLLWQHPLPLDQLWLQSWSAVFFDSRVKYLKATYPPPQRPGLRLSHQYGYNFGTIWVSSPRTLNHLSLSCFGSLFLFFLKIPALILSLRTTQLNCLKYTKSLKCYLECLSTPNCSTLKHEKSINFLQKKRDSELLPMWRKYIKDKN